MSQLKVFHRFKLVQPLRSVQAATSSVLPASRARMNEFERAKRLNGLNSLNVFILQ